MNEGFLAIYADWDGLAEPQRFLLNPTVSWRT